MAHTTREDEVKEKVERARSQLEAGLQALVTSEDWRTAMLALAALGPTRISRFSFRNIVLLRMQGLGEAHAATFNTWRKLSRPVKRGEKGRFILRPRFAKTVADGEGEEKQLIGFSCLTVFGLSQTEGEELAALQPQDFLAPDTFAQSVGTLREVALTLPHVSTVEVRERRPGDAPGAFGWFNRTTKAIVVLSDTTPAQQFATLVHELAHALLHGGDGHHDVAVKEVEAESTSFVVCHALGLDTGAFSFPYVAHWAGGEAPEKAVATAGENIRRASSRILEVLLPSEGQEGLCEAA